MKAKRFKLIYLLLAVLMLCSMLILTACGEKPAEEPEETTAVSTPKPTPTPVIDPEDCDHPRWINGICTKCHMHCEHYEYDHGKCVVCGMPCQHDWNNGVCWLCGAECDHPEFKDGVCTTCGFECYDHLYVDGVCVKCHHECEHSWYDGVCSICNLHCAHKAHDPRTGECKECGELTAHSYRDGLCVRCGKAFSFTYSDVPESFYGECDEPGEVQSFYYPAENIYNGQTLNRNVDIYLPYNYSPNVKYNVLILIHGGGGDESNFTQTEYHGEGKSFTMKDLYDNAIASHLCDPFILVSPSTMADFSTGRQDVSQDQFAMEIRDIILPYIAGMYSTYAASGSEEDLVAARAHFGIGGISNGSLYTYNVGMMRCFDLFGNYICMSGNNQPDKVAEAINSEEWKDLPIYCYYAGAGTSDGQLGNSQRGYEKIVASTDRLQDGKNSFYANVDGGHTWMMWSIGFYNAFQLLFPISEG